MHVAAHIFFATVLHSFMRSESVFRTVVEAAILVWALSGPFFNYSDTWHLVINTGTTIVTFLMVFLIQNSQNRDGAAIQAKLDEIVRAGRGQNVFVGIEHLTEDEIEELTKKCEARAKKAALRR